MKLTHPRIDTAFDDGINVLVAEEPRTFRQFCLDIFESFDGGEPFVLSDGNREVNLSKCGLLVENVLDFNVNDKKTGNALFNELANIAEKPQIFQSRYPIILKSSIAKARCRSIGATNRP